jgi:PAS domain-containing protein/DNA-binding protein Fis
VKVFRAPKTSLGDLDAEEAATLIAAAADITLILDEGGVIRDVAFNHEELSQELEGQRGWAGRRWVETVAEDSRAKVQALIADAGGQFPGRWRHVNQLSGTGASIPILFTAVRLGSLGRVVAFGRDLRPLSQLQQRLVQAQQSLERDYSRLRHAETRYRLLFRMSSEAVFILDSGAVPRVIEANDAARRLLHGNGGAAAAARGAADGAGTNGGPPAAQVGVPGRPSEEIFDTAGRESVQLLLSGVRSSGRTDSVRVRLAPDAAGAEASEPASEVVVSATLFRQDNATLFLVQVTGPGTDAARPIELPKPQAKMLKALQAAPDAFVVARHDGRILAANAAFLELAQVPNEEQARDEPLDRWLGRPGVDMEVLTATLRQRGSVRLFSTILRGEFGATAEVEVSAVSVLNGGTPCYGFTIRDVGARLAAAGGERRPGGGGPPATRGEVPRSVEQLTELIGRVPLKDLVREATDVIERLCIEAALELTGDNRASAAEMLGLSRQSLYVKLRRYGLGDLGPEGGAGGADGERTGGE